MNGDNLIGNERVLISQFLSEKDAHTHTNEFAVGENCQETDVDIYIHGDRTTPQSGHYPITGWAHASRDSNFNCSCILIGIMRLTTDRQAGTHTYAYSVNIEQKEIFIDNDINIWNDQSIDDFGLVLLVFVPAHSLSLSFIKIRYFHMNMWLLFSLPDVSIMLTREQHIFNLLIL